MIHSREPIADSQIQPVSIDLRLGTKAYRIQCSFLPENEPVTTKLKEVSLYEFDITDGGILEKNAIYLIPLMEELAFTTFFVWLGESKKFDGQTGYVHPGHCGWWAPV